MNKLENYLVIDGGTVKTEEEGIVTGMGIVFGSENEPDQSSMRDFFTADSFITKRKSFSVPLYYEHGLGIIDEEVGEAVLTKDVNGWKAVANIDTSTEAGKKVYERVKEKPHGFSSGAVSHLVKREAKANQTNFIKKWPVGELSITERPAERKAVVHTVKSVDGEVIYEPEDTKRFPTQEENDLAVTIAIHEDGGENRVWELESGEPIPEWAKDTKNVKNVDLKYAAGSISYTLYTGEEDTSVDINVIEYGDPAKVIAAVQNILSQAALAIKSNEEETLEDKIEKIVKSTLTDKQDNEQISELKTQLQDAKDKLASAEQKAADSETNLTEANEKIARLEILAGASEIIKKGK